MVKNLGRVVGKSAYELAVENGFEGTLEEWLESLKGENGQNGENGADGRTPVITIGENGNWYIDGVDSGESARASSGISSTAANLLCDILLACVTSGNQQSNIESLRTALLAGGADTPEDPDTPTGSPVSTSFSGATVTFSNLKTLNISYSGTTAMIGG